MTVNREKTAVKQAMLLSADNTTETSDNKEKN